MQKQSSYVKRFGIDIFTLIGEKLRTKSLTAKCHLFAREVVEEIEENRQFLLILTKNCIYDFIKKMYCTKCRLAPKKR